MGGRCTRATDARRTSHTTVTTCPHRSMATTDQPSSSRESAMLQKGQVTSKKIYQLPFFPSGCSDPVGTVGSSSRSSDPVGTVGSSSRSSDPVGTVGTSSRSCDPVGTVGPSSRSRDHVGTGTPSSRSSDSMGTAGPSSRNSDPVGGWPKLQE